MAENIYRFEFVDETGQQQLESGIVNTLGSGTSEKPSGRTSNKTFSDTFANRVENNLLQQTVISPLNTATGGLARPIASAVKSISKGASVGQTLGTLGGSLAIAGVMLAINYLQNRVKEMETKVENLGNTDNAMLRAGSVSQATYYSANILGIKKTTNRS